MLPGRESSSGVSRDEQKQGHPHRDEYFQIRSFAASEQVEEPGPRSAAGEADLRDPVVQTAALLTEQVQLLQSRVLPGALSGVLFTQEEEEEEEGLAPHVSHTHTHLEQRSTGRGCSRH